MLTVKKEKIRIYEKLQTLANFAQHEVPDPFGFAYYGEPITQEEERNHDNQAIKSFYKRMGVPHLFELHKEGNY